MNNPLTTDHARSFALLLARLPLGVYFLLAGFNKFASGVRVFVEDNLQTVPEFLGPQLGKAYLWALPSVEMLVGVTLIIGLYTRVSATLIMLMLVSFIIADSGIGFKPNKPPMLDKNVVFLGLAILLMTTGAGRIAVDQTFGNGSAPGPGKK